MHRLIARLSVLSILGSGFIVSTNAAELVANGPAVVKTDAVDLKAEPFPTYEAQWESFLRSEREERLADLMVYAQNGRFPLKPEQAGWHHQFLDANGTPCAVASLIWTSGNAPLVQHTASVDNDILVAEVESGPLAEWVALSGLTKEEVAFIQAPSFTAERFEKPVLLVEDPEPSPEELEVARLQRRLNSVISMLQADTEASIWKAMARLGDRVDSPPPLEGVIAMNIDR